MFASVEGAVGSVDIDCRLSRTEVSFFSSGSFFTSGSLGWGVNGAVGAVDNSGALITGGAGGVEGIGSGIDCGGSTDVGILGDSGMGGLCGWFNGVESAETASTLVGSPGFASGSAGLNPSATSNSSFVNPFRTTLCPSSFSTLVTGVPEKLSPTASISVRNSLFVSKFFSSY